MRRIDLACKLLGPLSIALIDGFSPRLALLIIFITNLMSVFIEYMAIAQVCSLLETAIIPSHIHPGLSNDPHPRLLPAQYSVSSNLLPHPTQQLSIPPLIHLLQIHPPTPLIVHPPPRLPPLPIPLPPLLHRPLLLRPNDHLPPLRTRYKAQQASNLLHHSYRSPTNTSSYIRDTSDMAGSSYYEETRAYPNRSVGH